ncbi:alpha/beta hydrolase [Gordonia rhizosphera]|uniref:Putative 2,6-dihydroxypseudooxynicotine hydrolase n=1 Tax=Gordonia rhizosphera NBRC 16068 TaxID=1108045 RepID=K6V869_9ACTN|nr:alpha/beta hydrolase [Gordonia rhizosphera]GAB92403.1 putative 2,6-dihydroxypseudooxynicotine hydrolase [Gordonia rhizosphera NBRC 16068]
MMADPVLDVRPTAANTAHWRAMGVTRLLDAGMRYDDLLALQAATIAGEPWDEVAERLGAARMAQAQEAAAAHRTVSAHDSYRAAAACYVFAQMAFNFDTDRKRALYAAFDAAVAEAARFSPVPMRRIELEFGAGRLTGWHLRPQGSVGTVVVFGGQSGWGATYLRYADALLGRGVAVILAEGPGQGGSRLTYGVHLDVDVAAAFGTFVDLAASDGPVGVWGNSVGGLFAALTAARHPGVAACCVNGGFAVPRLLPFRTFSEQAKAMLGSRDDAAVTANFERLRFDPTVDRIECPLLVLHGGADPLVELDDQRPFLDGAAHGTLRIWKDGEHTIYNHADERNATAADWFAERLTEYRETVPAP